MSITYGPNENCTLETCNVSTSIFEYRPSIAANSVFIALFGFTLALHVVQGLKWRTWAFMIAMALGCIIEMVGYGGRIMLWKNPFSFPGFLIQGIGITLGPAFYSAAIYLTLSKIVSYLGTQYSRFRPNFYYWFFIPCDIVSLALQATGGAMSSKSSGSSKVGVNIAIAGLSFQVVTLVIFIILSLEYAFRYLRGQRTQQHDANMRTRFKIFIAFLSLAIILILIRCSFRIDELSNGYSGPLIHNEGLFIGLEGVMIIMAAYSLNIAHPGPVFGRSSSASQVFTENGHVGDKTDAS